MATLCLVIMHAREEQYSDKEESERQDQLDGNIVYGEKFSQNFLIHHVYCFIGLPP